MGKFTLSVFINRSQQDVFDFLSNPANLSKWEFEFHIRRVDIQQYTWCRFNLQRAS